MFSRTVLLSLVLITALLVGGVCSQTLKLTQLSEARICGLPAVNWPYHIDGTDEVIGIISDLGRWFTLYGADGEPIFTTRAGHTGFCSVEISPYDGVVLLTDRSGDEPCCPTAYDYSGTKIFDAGKTDFLATSPTGRFFLAIYRAKREPGRNRGPGQPAVFGHDGQLLAQYDLTSPYWDMKAIGDTMVLYQDGPTVMTIKIPELTVDTVMKVDNVNRPMYPASAISPDGLSYAFVVVGKFAVCNLVDREALFVDIQNVKGDIPGIKSWPHDTRILLAPGGEYVIVYWQHKMRVHQIQVWKLDVFRYVEIAHEISVPFDIGMQFPFGPPVITDDFCVINYFSSTRTSLTFRSYAFDYKKAEGSFLNGVVLNGYTSLAPHSESEIRVLEVDPNTSGCYTLKRFRVDVQDER